MGCQGGRSMITVQATLRPATWFDPHQGAALDMTLGVMGSGDER
ncbi:MAG: hypothetical protein JWO52_6629 [Gammaproteobacteria bacterium]|nr:hypothetical protein [Gammaproteobacteria bacterium]